MSSLQTPGHKSTRTAFRIAGPVVLLVALGFIMVGGVDFFSAMNGFGTPKLFWCFFIGLPLLFVGAVLSMLGYMGAIARYTAAEQVPVATDTINDLVAGTKDAVKTVARSVAEGVKEAQGERK